MNTILSIFCIHSFISHKYYTMLATDSTLTTSLHGWQQAQSNLTHKHAADVNPNLNLAQPNSIHKVWHTHIPFLFIRCPCRNVPNMDRSSVFRWETFSLLTMTFIGPKDSFQTMHDILTCYHDLYMAQRQLSERNKSRRIFFVCSQFNPLPALTYQTVLDLNATCRSKLTETYWLFSS